MNIPISSRRRRCVAALTVASISAIAVAIPAVTVAQSGSPLTPSPTVVIAPAPSIGQPLNGQAVATQSTDAPATQGTSIASPPPSPPPTASQLAARQPQQSVDPNAATGQPNFIAVPPQKLPPDAPSSGPLVITNGPDNGSAANYYSTTSGLNDPAQQNVNTFDPESMSQFSDPALRNQTEPTRTLPLFGYDFFAAPRNLIDARKQSLEMAATGQYGVPTQPVYLQPQYANQAGQYPYGGRYIPSGSQQNGTYSPGQGQSAYYPGQNPQYGTNGQPYTGQPDVYQNGASPAANGTPASPQPNSGYTQGTDNPTYSSSVPAPTPAASTDIYGQPIAQNGQPVNTANVVAGQTPLPYVTGGPNPQSGGYDQSGQPIAAQANTSTYGNSAYGNSAYGTNTQYGAPTGATQPNGTTNYGTATYGIGQPGTTQYGPSASPLPYGYVTTNPNSTSQAYPQNGQPGNTYATRSPYAPNGYYAQNAGYPATAQSGYGDAGQPIPPIDEPLSQVYGNATAEAPIDAYHDVADPFSQLFRNVQQSLPPDYQLNPGDTLTVRVWSPTIPMREFTRTIDNRGMIYLTDIGPQVVRGLSAAQAENILRAKLSRLYRNVDVSITLAELRTMQVTVSGLAYAPGTYTVPAGTSAFNLFYASGGPTLDGTLRKVEIHRHGLIVGNIDMYSFILGTNSASSDISLQPGDILYVSPRLSRVTVHGDVRRQAIFEVTDTDTLADLIRYAGGANASAVTKRIQLDTYEPGSARILRDVDLADTAQEKSTPLYDGDDVDVFSVPNEIANRVTIEGDVKEPGDYALEPGLKLSALLDRARGVKDDAYTPRADLFRWKPDNTLDLIPVNLDDAIAHDPTSDVTLSKWDRIYVYSRQEVAWTGRREVTVRGAVQRPGIYYRADNLHAKDLLIQAGGPLADAYLNRAVLLHRHSDGSFSYDYVDVAEALKPDGDPGPAIEDNDVLAVYKVGEAEFIPEHLVTIKGRVLSPGIYPRGTAMRISDLLKLSGGFTPYSAFQLELTHVPTATTPNAPASTSQIISLDADHNLADGDDKLLQDGDVVTVQGIGGIYPNVRLVTITGAVVRPGPVPIETGMRLSDAIKAAGGFLPEAFPQGAEFTRDPKFLTSDSQDTITETIKEMNDLLNVNEYQRQLAKSDVDRIQAVQDVSQPSAIAGLGVGTSAPASVSPDTVAQLNQRQLVSPARYLSQSQLSPSGNIAVNLVAAVNRPGDRDDLPLEDGDTLNVPVTPTTIQVVGAVYNSRGILFRPGANIGYYIDLAGGYAPDAARDKIEIIHLGGGLMLADRSTRLMPGDVILVPTKVLAASISSSHNQLSTILSSITNSAILLKIVTSVF